MSETLPPTPEPVPPRAFTQGVGTVFQFVGVILFLSTMFICCGSSFLSKDVAERKDWTMIGWGSRLEVSEAGVQIERPAYSATRAMTLCVTLGVLLGITLAGLGLGLQAQTRRAPLAAVLVSAAGTMFWLVQALFFVQKLHSILLALLALALLIVFAVLCLLASGAWRERKRSPPPADLGILPPDYKMPYSHYHVDPPEVRLAAELEQRRQRIAVQQKELEMLEERIRRRRNEQP
jgi:lysylphosphatidylglycerol synthetase-like protein (DUF2156 family)